jgi:hypothetical protein
VNVAHRPVGGLLLALVLVSLLVAGCAQKKLLSGQEVSNRAQEYFQRGMEQFQRGELRPALESFRLAKAYDAAGANSQIAEMIEKTEAKLRLPNSSAAAAASGSGAPRSAAPQLAPPATAAQGFKTFRSRLYPYSIDLPESWGPSASQPVVNGIRFEVLSAPGSPPVELSTLALPLQPDVDARAFFESMRKGLRAMGLDPIDVARRKVDGTDAFIMRATGTDPVNGKQVATMAMFERERVGWLIMFAAAADQSERLQPMFHSLLDTFHAGELNNINKVV